MLIFSLYYKGWNGDTEILRDLSKVISLWEAGWVCMTLKPMFVTTWGHCLWGSWQVTLLWINKWSIAERMGFFYVSEKILFRVTSLEALFLKAHEPVKGSRLNTESTALGSPMGSLVIGSYTMTDQLSYPSSDSFPRCQWSSVAG